MSANQHKRIMQSSLRSNSSGEKLQAILASKKVYCELHNFLYYLFHLLIITFVNWQLYSVTSCNCKSLWFFWCSNFPHHLFVCVV